MDEEKERQKEIREKLESEGLDPDEFDEEEREELATDESLQNVVANNVRQSSELEFKGVFNGKVDDQFEIDRKLWEQLTNNPELNKYIEKKMFKYVADKILALREE
ncbi:MAG: hypothetical protein AAB366_02125 [Patescibacteria group bacterium]